MSDTISFNPIVALDQLTESNNGVRRLRAMVGGKDFVQANDYVQFGFKSCRKANKCRITLNPNDTYTIEFFKFNRKTFECPCVDKTEGVYHDMLKDIFESFTGLYLSL